MTYNSNMSCDIISYVKRDQQTRERFVVTCIIRMISLVRSGRLILGNSSTKNITHGKDSSSKVKKRKETVRIFNKWENIYKNRTEFFYPACRSSTLESGPLQRKFVLNKWFSIISSGFSWNWSFILKERKRVRQAGLFWTLEKPENVKF